MVFLPIELV